MTTATVAGQFRFFDAHVVRSRRLGPSMVRITFGGEQLREFAGGGRDQSFSLFLPQPGQHTPVLPETHGEGRLAEWRAMDPAVRAVMRSYTVREQRREQAEVDVDFALHGDLGPASRWAGEAAGGENVVLLGPAVEDNRSVGFRPPLGTDWVLIAADETALPAVGAILDWLPAGMRARVWIEVPHAEDVMDLPCAGDAEITWLVRDHAPGPRPALLVDAVRAAVFPGGMPYAWVAGESGAVKAVRRHLVRERGIDRKRVHFSGYWRLGASEEDLRAEAALAAA
ncbi:siderophore-interacting protein [Streptomyces sp. NPDC002536]